MNCGVCVSYLAMTNDLKTKGFSKGYCPGCLPRGKNCSFMKKQCEQLRKGLLRFCYECEDFPCPRLKALDKRYRSRFHMSMIDNLVFIQAHGMEAFLEKETGKWRCPKCGDVLCCHNGLCFNCGLDKLRQNKKYRWDENWKIRYELATRDTATVFWMVLDRNGGCQYGTTIRIY